MRIHVHFTAGSTRIDEVVAGDTPDAIVSVMRDKMAAQMGILIGGFLRHMTPIAFAQEATRRYNAATGAAEPLPQTCAEFLSMGERGGFATRLPDA